MLKEARSSSVSLRDPEAFRQDERAKTASFFARRNPIRIDSRLITELKEISRELGNKNVRICLHENPSASFHQMVILERPGRYYRPHKHIEKGEAFHLIEGRLGVFVFDESGSVTEACVLDPQENLIYRTGTGVYHAVLPLSDYVIYHESKQGPFLGDQDSVYPEWAPDGAHPNQVQDYVNRLVRHLPEGEHRTRS